MHDTYVHRYDASESTRLRDQAGTLEDLLHGDTCFPAGSEVLEAGCGVGAQTVALARRSPDARITCVDIAASSLREAEARALAAGLDGVRFHRADLCALPFAEASFDHAFVCFVLEHLPRPDLALAELRRVLRPGGSLTVIEGDHESALFHPDDDAARAAIRCLMDLQRATGGDACIGRRLYPLLREADLRDVSVSPRLVYVDASRPALVEGFIRRTFIAMIAGVKTAAIMAGLTDAPTFDAGIRALHRTTATDGVFCYTFFKAVGRRT
ncbi:Methyltransferase domain-containing protein [Rhodovastum atsumiense]|uniref:Methyltransferase domain-containing protein n=1 Tax=Rhodovastum atsumiense TaxID=504468 RepID=A0A5M6IR95_9PROT|nr:methyltransferase domain-containing protein [Rhodovastum atsumiense]KAA5610812.1 methyltransferase domain-containing protein [Rhodovastum atsumiense]CAH2602142.1 Methyltransferase domain-containing protein [Rhodovastum atsumiense]